MKAADRFLNFLQVERGAPTLDLLNELVKSHQLRVRWETVSKILDWEEGNRTGNFLPSFDRYVERIVEKGFGGTCWSIAVGLHELLKDLGYDVHFMYMDSGHLALRVNLDQPYYVDCGYCAPLFQAYPLFESFTAQNARETFQYTVSEEGIVVVRDPGPTKTLDPNPVLLEEMQPHIRRSNDWSVSPVFLQDIRIFGYIDGTLTSLINNTLKQYAPDNVTEQELTEEELLHWVANRFGMEYDMYRQAVRIHQAKTAP